MGYSTGHIIKLNTDSVKWWAWAHIYDFRYVWEDWGSCETLAYDTNETQQTQELNVYRKNKNLFCVTKVERWKRTSSLSAHHPGQYTSPSHISLKNFIRYGWRAHESSTKLIRTEIIFEFDFYVFVGDVQLRSANTDRLSVCFCFFNYSARNMNMDGIKRIPFDPWPRRSVIIIETVNRCDTGYRQTQQIQSISHKQQQQQQNRQQQYLQQP